MEHLFGAALAVVIVAAVGLTLYTTLGGGPGGARASGKPHYQCLECEYVFRVEVDDIPPEKLRKATDPSMVLLDCPDCGAESSALEMTKCPKCGEHYVAQRTRYMVEHGVPAPGDVRDVCPHCGTDRKDYMRQDR